MKLLKETEEPVIRTATTYVLSGKLTEEQTAAIKAFCINPVDSREAGSKKPQTLVTVFETPADVASFEGFTDFDTAQLKELYDSLNLAMTFRDFEHIQKYYAGEEHRDPTVTEIRVLDTYWSDHCRHTTFSTKINDVKINNGKYADVIKAAYDEYKAAKADLYAPDRDTCLMNMATIIVKQLKKQGLLKEIDESEEINACSIVVDVDENGKDLNSTSIVLKITYGNTSFLFTGDAESDEEEEILNSGADLKSTVLKVGHHGSRTSTSYPFLREVMPQYAVISVEKGNSYGHPNEETLSKLSLSLIHI